MLGILVLAVCLFGQNLLTANNLGSMELILRHGEETKALGPPTSVSLRSSLEMQNHEPHFRPVEPEAGQNRWPGPEGSRASQTWRCVNVTQRL